MQNFQREGAPAQSPPDRESIAATAQQPVSQKMPLTARGQEIGNRTNPASQSGKWKSQIGPARNALCRVRTRSDLRFLVPSRSTASVTRIFFSAQMLP